MHHNSLKTLLQGYYIDIMKFNATRGVTFFMHTDKVLLERIQKREPKALEELYHRYSSYLYTLIKRKIDDAHKIISLLKQLFQEIWQNPHHFLQEKYVSISLTKYCMRNS